ncbi:MAG: C1 family peptidase [Patescibacteria group bacterium]
METSPHNYGWIPDLPDKRDVAYCKAPRRKLPIVVDLRGQCLAIENQEDLGSCTAHALTGATEFLVTKAGFPPVQLSRLFLYYQERMLEGNIPFDSGAMIRDGIKALKRWGVCREELWPYRIQDFTKSPPPAAYEDAEKRQILSYQRLSTLQDMLNCLANGFPFVFGFTVYESFESEEVAKTGVAPMPGDDEEPMGGHAVLAVGYNQKEKRLIVRNSWGSAWGKAGYFTMPFAYVQDRDLSDDFWVVYTQEEGC